MNSKNKRVNRLTYGVVFVFLLALLLIPVPSVVWAQNQAPYSLFSSAAPQGQGIFDSREGRFMPNTQESQPGQRGPSYERSVPSGPMGIPMQMGMKEPMGPRVQVPGSFGEPEGIRGPGLTGAAGQIAMPGQMGTAEDLGTQGPLERWNW